PDDQTVITASRAETKVQFANLATGEEIDAISHSGRKYYEAFALSPDGKTFVLAGMTFMGGGKDAPLLDLYDTSTHKLIRSLEGAERHIASAIVTPDGKRLVTAEYPGTLRLWGLESGKPLRSWPGRGYLRAISPDGRTLLVDGRGLMADLVDLATGN